MYERVTVGEALASVLAYAYVVQMSEQGDDLLVFDVERYLDDCRRHLWDVSMEEILVPYGTKVINKEQQASACCSFPPAATAAVKADGSPSA